MGIKIRRAVKEDCARLLELVNELAVYEKAPQEVTVTLDHFIESGFGKNPVWYGFVADEDDVIKGFARGRGLGKLLFDQLIEEAKEKKFSGIVWQVLDWNEPAINFYKKYNAKFDGEWVNCSIEI